MADTAPTSPTNTNDEDTKKNIEKENVNGLVTLYVKGFGTNIDENELKNIFKPFGNVVNARIQSDNIGFVAYDSHIDALRVKYNIFYIACISLHVI